MKQSLSVADYRLVMITLGLLIVSLFLNLGLVPLSFEEPRRALIALEMLLNGNLLVPTEMGELYYKKPPMFNWLLLASFKLFGEYSELAARSVTVVFLMLWGLLNFYFLKRHTSIKLALYSSLMLVISADMYFSFSMLGEIDIFYSFITYASIIAIYHFYQTGQLLLLFLSCYFLNAIGLLTKGIPSLLFPVISLGVFFMAKGAWKKLVTWQHAAGILLFLLVGGGYFVAYSYYNNPAPFADFLWTQSSKRTVLEIGFWKLIVHFFSFPLVTLKDVLPASILLLFAFKKDLFRTLWKHEMIRFCLLMFGANIIVYWLSPGTRSRYVYMLYPFLIITFVYLFYEYKNSTLWASKLLYFLRWIILPILAITCLVAPWIDQLEVVEEAVAYSIGGVLLITFLFFFIQSNKPSSMPTLVLMVVLIRLMFDMFVLPVRAMEGEQYLYKQDAQKIVQLTVGEQVHLYGPMNDGNMSLGLVWYIERDKLQVLDIANEKNCEDYFIAHQHEVKNQEVEVYYEFTWKEENHYYLFKFKDCP